MLAMANIVPPCFVYFYAKFKKDYQMFKKLVTSFVVIAAASSLYFAFNTQTNHNLPVIAIANYGPHSSLEETILGIKKGLEHQNIKDVHYEILDVNFDVSLIPQMISKLKALHPKVFVTLSTPVTQAAKNKIKDIPVVFADVTDPLGSGILTHDNQSEGNLTGASDRQDLKAFLNFSKVILPQAKTVGLLYSTGEANDSALLKMMQDAAKETGFEVLAVGVDHPRDIPLRIKAFKNKADFIYVGTSGTIQPSLPAIVAEADRLRLPIFNADSDAVKNHQALASFGVKHLQVGMNTAFLIGRILNQDPVEVLKPIHPSLQDHQGFISLKRAKHFNITLPSQLENITVIE
jgi:putative tryptophan/tyrosine transport system substrate-binding protein